MPYEVREIGDQYCVCGEDGQPVEGGCHATPEEAEDHRKALYANVEDASYAAPARLRLNLVSEVALAEGGAARPIHILRTGTFTGMSGTPVTFKAKHLQSIVENFQAGKRKNPPITERHDFGRAIGRMQNVWADATYDNLYSLPKWNAEGRKLLADEIYDGFSVELDPDDEGFTLVGGSLTNYPAVQGLEAVTLSAPPIGEIVESEFIDPEVTTMLASVASSVLPSAPPAPPSQARADTPTLLQQPMEVFMSDQSLEQTTLPNVSPPAPTVPPVPVFPTVSDAGMQAQLEAYMRQMETRNQEMQRAVLAQAQAEFERRTQEMLARSQIEAFARRATTTSYNQPWALPCKSDEFATLLTETPVNVRGKWESLVNRILTSGLLSFDEIGSSGEGAEAADMWEALVSSKVAAGMTRVEAHKAAAKEQPALYDAQSYAKKGGR